MKADVLALAAIALWGALAPLGVQLAHIPPFMLTGIGLLVGSVIALPLARFRLARWKVPLATLAVGIYGLFGFHFLLFMALRHAPAVQANLINYLWPLGMVVMAPLFSKDIALQARHIVAAIIGFIGAAIAILWRSASETQMVQFHWGYLMALASAFVWASYSLLTQRVAPFATASIGVFGLLSGLLSLLCHSVLENAVALDAQALLLIVGLGLGPLGGAFYLWDAALKRGDARQIGLLSFLTPLLSTLGLLWMRGEAASASIVLAAALIVGAALLGSRTQ